MTEPEKKTVVYTVQMEITSNTGSGTDAWLDIATVSVPSGAKRKTVLLKALAETDVEIGENPRLRALDTGSAEVHEPEAVTTTQWRLT